MTNESTIRLPTPSVVSPRSVRSSTESLPVHVPWLIIMVHRQGKGRSRFIPGFQRKLKSHINQVQHLHAQRNPAKAAVTWFSINKHLVNKLVSMVSFCGDTVERTNLINYSGVRFDLSFRFKDLVSHITTEARKGLAANVEQLVQ